MNINPQEHATLDRELGRIEGRLSAMEHRQQELERRLDKKLTEVETTLTELGTTLEGIEDLLQQAKGAYKLGAWVVGVFGAIGAVVAWYFGIWKS